MGSDPFLLAVWRVRSCVVLALPLLGSKILSYRFIERYERHDTHILFSLSHDDDVVVKPSPAKQVSKHYRVGQSC